jgi:gluconokinase
LRGRVLGLDLSHDKRHLARAALEGVVFALFSVYEVVRELTGTPSNIMLSGGLTHVPFVRQLVADVFGIDSVLPDRDEASAFGAAMMAGIAIGAVDGLGALDRVVTRVATYAPRAREHDSLREAYARYRSAVDHMLEETVPEAR